jgi:enoyl-CoA hydratase/carnithine racemase
MKESQTVQDNQPAQDFQTLTFTVAPDHVATITLNRPEALNAFNQAMLDEFVRVWARCREDDSIHAIVLQANGDRAFCTGVDRKQGRRRAASPWNDDDPGISLGAKQNRVWKPLVCALNGMVAGGAFYLVNEADIVIAAEDIELFDPHVSYGMTAALEPIGLLRRMPFGDVMRLALMGLDERIGAGRALAIGFVTEIVPKQALRERAHQLAKRLAAKPPVAVQGTVKALWQSMEMSASGARVIPMLYPQVGNPLARTEFSPASRPEYELR